MALHYGVRVTAYNISHEQILYARQRARDLGLEDRVTFVEDDYRRIADRYDVFASIGMLEHVGLAQLSAMGQVMETTTTSAFFPASKEPIFVSSPKAFAPLMVAISRAVAAGITCGSADCTL